MEEWGQEDVCALRDFGKQQPVMATVREGKTDMEGNVFTTAAVGGRLSEEGGRDSPTLRSARSAPVGPQGWVVLHCAHLPLYWGGGRAHILFIGKVTPPQLW